MRKPYWREGPPIEITIGEEDEPKSLVSELEEFDLSAKPLLKATKKVEKKKEKKKKKSALSEALNDSLTMADPTKEIESKVEEVDVIDYYSIIRDEFEDSLNDNNDDDFYEIISEKKGSRKKDNDGYKKEFAENIDLLYNLLKNARDFESKIEKKYDSLDNGGKVRGVSKYTTDLANAVIQARNNTLSIIKEINSVKKTAVDLQIKADSKKNDANANQSNDLIASTFLSNIMNNYGRGNMIKDLMGGGSSMSMVDDDDEDEIVNEMIASLKGDDGLSKYKHDTYMDRIGERLENEDNPYRSQEANSYIQFEHLEPKILVKLCIDTGDYKFIAVDKDNQEIYGYPIPDKSSIGKLSFSNDNNYATDSKGRSYKVISYFSGDE